MCLLDTRSTPPARITHFARFTLGVTIGEFVSELDAVLSDEASRPW